MKRNEQGGATIEIAIIAPVLILMLLMVVAFGRVTSASGDVDGAARDAARAASLRDDKASAVVAAEKAAASSLQSGSASCRSHQTQVDVSHFGAGGYVAVDVTCKTDLSDLSLLRLPGSKSIHSRFVSVVDTYSTRSTS